MEYLVHISDGCKSAKNRKKLETFFTTEIKYRGFLTRKVYLYYISCLRYTTLVRNPRYTLLYIASTH